MPALHKELLKSFSIFLFSVVAGIYIYYNDSWQTYLLHLGNLEYLGIFLAGILFVLSPTFGVSVSLLLIFSENFNIYWITFIAALGGSIADYLIFKTAQRNLNNRVYKQLKNKYLSKNKKASLFITILGFLIILSPLPDEIGLTFIGHSKLKPSLIFWMCFILNFISIYILLFFTNVI